MEVKKIDPTNFDVGEYLVHLEPESCTCMGWTIRGGEQGFRCKHIKMVLNNTKNDN